MKWEYLFIDMEYPDNDAGRARKESDLRNLGEEGWELVSIANGILKRPKPDGLAKEEATEKPPPDTGYTYETVQDGYVIFGPDGRKIPGWDVVSLLNQYAESRKRNDG